MDTKAALSAFEALGQPARLAAFRVLVCAGATGMSAGEIGLRVGSVQNTMSAHLSVLLHAGLVRNHRHGRQIRYYADMESFGRLLAYLLEQCCGGAPETCRPFIGTIISPSGEESTDVKCTA